MKKILFVLALLITAFAAQSQVRNMYTLSYTNARDTVTNAGSETWGTPVLANNKIYSILFNITKISGTLGGTIRLVYSTNGTDFYSSARDTVLTIADASAVYGWNITDIAAPYVGVQWIGTGTMSGSAIGAISGKSRQ